MVCGRVDVTETLERHPVRPHLSWNLAPWEREDLTSCYLGVLGGASSGAKSVLVSWLFPSFHLRSPDCLCWPWWEELSEKEGAVAEVLGEGSSPLLAGFTGMFDRLPWCLWNFAPCP